MTRTIVFAIALASGFAAAHGEDKTTGPDPGTGRQLAERLCQGCHVIGGDQTTQVPVGVPTFQAIANKPGQTGDHIVQILIKPHAPMPDMQLTRAEVLHLLSYIDGLRDPGNTTPLLPETDQPNAKPEYPKPS